MVNGTAGDMRLWEKRRSPANDEIRLANDGFDGQTADTMGNRRIRSSIDGYENARRFI